MKLIHVDSVLGVVASALGQPVVICAPTSGTVLSLGQNFAAQLLVFVGTQLEVHHASIY